MDRTTPSDTASGTASPADVALAVMAAHVDMVESLSTTINQLEHLRVTQLAALSSLADAFADDEGHADHGLLMHRTVEAEVAAAAHIGPLAAARRVAHAHALVTDYPVLARSLQTGAVSIAHTEVVVAAGALIDDPGARAAYEAEAVPLAQTMTAYQLKPHAKRLAECYASRPLEQRHAEANAGREVRVADLDDGMAQLIATIGAVEAYAIKDRLSRIAHHARSSDGNGAGGDGGGEQRTARQIQADVLIELLLTGGSGGTGGASEAGGPTAVSPVTAEPLAAIRGRVQITVPALTLAETRDAQAAPYLSPAELAGYGPVPLETARRITAHAPAWERVLTHPVSGAVLAVDRYRPSEDLRRLLGARDQHCRFLGCTRRLDHCDIDHTVPASEGGPTTPGNTGHLCRAHHRLKHWRFLGESGWKPRLRPDGVYEWRSPTGRRYRDAPKSTVRFAPRPMRS